MTSRTNITEALRRLRKVYENDEGAPEVFEAVRVLLVASCEHPESYYWCSECGFAAEPSEPTGFDLRSNDVRPPRSDAPDADTDEYPNRKRRRLTEPRSDAVTASDEPPEHNHEAYACDEACPNLKHLEARAASASVPPLDEPMFPDALLIYQSAVGDEFWHPAGPDCDAFVTEHVHLRATGHRLIRWAGTPQRAAETQPNKSSASPEQGQ